MDQRTERVGEMVTGKALDDRVCLFAMLEAADRLEAPDATIHFCATVQEEVGLRGARALGVDVDPDLAIALDVTVANDVPGFDAGNTSRNSARFRDQAQRLECHHEPEGPPADESRRRGSTTNSRSCPPAAPTRQGSSTAGAKPVGAISVPTRYLHTVTEAAHVDDVAATIDLLEAFLETEDGEHDYTL